MTERALPDKGALFEARVARLLSNEGSFVRRRVPLEPHYGEKFAITDLDVLSFTFDRRLSTSIAVVECKATETRNAPSGGDRLLWLSGLRRLVRADHAALYVTKSAGDPLRRLAVDLGSAVADERDVIRREERLGLTETRRSGSHHPSLLSLPDDARKALKADQELMRAYWFARSDLWLTTPTSALKRALGAARIVGSHYSSRLPPAEELALRWLAAELLVGITLAVTRLAGNAYHLPESIFADQMHERLSEGLADQRSLEQLSKAVDEYMTGVLRQVGASPAVIVQSLGAFAPRTPNYADRLIELIIRFAGAPRAAADTARVTDELFAAAFANTTTPELTTEDPDEALRLIRLVAAFVGRQARLPDELLAPLGRNGDAAVTAPAGSDDVESEPDGTAPDTAKSTLFGER